MCIKYLQYTLHHFSIEEKKENRFELYLTIEREEKKTQTQSFMVIDDDNITI
jgi:hypothetical protein